jgi:molybdopterin-binding protein
MLNSPSKLLRESTIVSIITVDAVENLSLAEGKRAYAVIKASSVMVGIDF